MPDISTKICVQYNFCFMSSGVKLNTCKEVFQQHVWGGGQGKREVGDEKREGEQEGEGRKIGGGGGREGKRGKFCALQEGRRETRDIKRYEWTEVDRRTWLHLPAGTHWSTCSSIHLVVEIIGGTSDWLGCHCYWLRVWMSFTIRQRETSYCCIRFLYRQ